ncbi:hypothetical protein BJF79_12545 [Actinomadura sp. CNU-125]|uniref:hypothetical protein n=1 Tax=Actinomadura sp. CNU-125 TaxID=1904961 RepID=UPI000966A441|nr:hypothetical protein [Actinomadura sp. CNU-125]OLT25948.1 hypothetical protein BJF79_12545 [Actinomadura sp. CNU-125]
MNSFFPVVPSGSGTPEHRRDGEITGRDAPATHRPGELSLGGEGTREENWRTIGARTVRRLTELSGTPIDWFANLDTSSGDGRSYAVTLGESGLSFAEPRVNAEHRPVYAISSFQFAPGSLRHVPVNHRPAPRAAGPSAPGAPPPDLGLSRRAREVLGNLPAQAQELLQAPFLQGQKILRNQWYYEGWEQHLPCFVFVLAGAKDVTAATGSMVVPAGHSAATAHWTLTCYRASVARRIGR